VNPSDIERQLLQTIWRLTREQNEAPDTHALMHTAEMTPLEVIDAGQALRDKGLVHPPVDGPVDLWVLTPPGITQAAEDNR
jgi:hypothetical protein